MPDPVTGAVVGGAQLLGGAYQGRQARKGAESAANTQAAAAREGQAILREDLAPFTGLGQDAANLLMQSVYGVGAPTNVADMDAARARMAAIDAELATIARTPQSPQSQGLFPRLVGGAGYGDANSQDRQRLMSGGALGGAVSRAVSAVDPRLSVLQQERDALQSRLNPQYALQAFNQPDPNEVLNNPFFKALADQQMNAQLNERSALGLAGSGGTQDSLMRNLLLLGNDFQQQNLQNKMAQNQQRFSQLFGVTGIGQASAAQTGAAGMNTANAIGQLNSISPLARAQERSNMVGNIMQLGGMAVGSGMLGGGGGGNLFSVGSGSTVPNYTPGGGVQFDMSRW